MVMKPLLRYVKERMQNLLKMFFLSEVVGNNQSRLFSSTPCVKKATTSSSSLALGAGVRDVEEGVSLWGIEEATYVWGGWEGEGEGMSLQNVWEESESSIVVAKLSL